MSELTHHRFALPTPADQQFETVWHGGMWRQNPPPRLGNMEPPPSRREMRRAILTLLEDEGMFYLTAPEIAARIGIEVKDRDFSTMLSYLCKQRGALERVGERGEYAYRLARRLCAA